MAETSPSNKYNGTSMANKDDTAGNARNAGTNGLATKSFFGNTANLNVAHVA